jgi:predicted AlkP superfamily pyrophosphatase or phosphodiesterase
VPKALTGRRIVRRLLTKLARPWLGFEGYFDLYNIPFQYIANYDFTEKKSPLKPKGMNRGTNIFDFLVDKKIPYFVSDPDLTEEQNRDVLCDNLSKEEIDFAFMYWPGLDGLLHRVGNDSLEVPAKMRLYEEWIDQVLAAAKGHYEEVRLFVFSDHGMANCDEHIDVMSVIDKLPLKFGTDYGVVYDSTMARFWFLKPGSREIIEKALATIPEGRILPDEELKGMRAYFDDGRFGELIFLLREGALLVPSHMGQRPIRAMHGFHPKDKHSYATLMTNQFVDSDIKAIPDIYKLMTRHALAAQEALVEEPSYSAAA